MTPLTCVHTLWSVIVFFAVDPCLLFPGERVSGEASAVRIESAVAYEFHLGGAA